MSVLPEGQGKTTVVTPLLSFVLADAERLIVIALPSNEGNCIESLKNLMLLWVFVMHSTCRALLLV